MILAKTFSRKPKFSNSVYGWTDFLTTVLCNKHTRQRRFKMEEERLKERAASTTTENDWETWDNWNEDLEKALPNWDRWNNDLKQLIPDDEKPEKVVQTETPGPIAAVKDPEPAPAHVTPVKEVEPMRTVVTRQEKVSELPKKQEILTSDKQLLFFIQKYKRAEIICREAGISLRTLQSKVGCLTYKLKRYIEVEGLYRETSPVKFTDEGISISSSHLIETGFASGDRFRLDFKDKYIVLTKLQKPTSA
jgi:hypothetical protein